MMHTMERYFSKYEDALLTDAIAEALLKTVMAAAKEVLISPDDYTHHVDGKLLKTRQMLIHHITCPRAPDGS